MLNERVVELPGSLHDVASLSDILNIATWNELLTDGERRSLAQLLPQQPTSSSSSSTSSARSNASFQQNALVRLLHGENMHFGGDLQSIFAQLRHGAMHPSVVRHRDIERERTRLRSEARWRRHALAALQACAAWRRAQSLAVDDAALAAAVGVAQSELDQLDVDVALATRDSIEAEQSELDADDDDDVARLDSDDDSASQSMHATAIGELNFWHDMDRKLTGSSCPFVSIMSTLRHMLDTI